MNVVGYQSSDAVWVSSRLATKYEKIRKNSNITCPKTQFCFKVREHTKHLNVQLVWKSYQKKYFERQLASSTGDGCILKVSRGWHRLHRVSAERLSVKWSSRALSSTARTVERWYCRDSLPVFRQRGQFLVCQIVNEKKSPCWQQRCDSVRKVRCLNPKRLRSFGHVILKLSVFYRDAHVLLNKSKWRVIIRELSWCSRKNVNTF